MIIVWSPENWLQKTADLGGRVHLFETPDHLGTCVTIIVLVLLLMLYFMYILAKVDLVL